jgi:hypothetical protein
VNAVAAGVKRALLAALLIVLASCRGRASARQLWTLEARPLQAGPAPLWRAEPLRAAGLCATMLWRLPRPCGLARLLRTARLLLLCALPVGCTGLSLVGLRRLAGS